MRIFVGLAAALCFSAGGCSSCGKEHPVEDAGIPPPPVIPSGEIVSPTQPVAPRPPIVLATLDLAPRDLDLADGAIYFTTAGEDDNLTGDISKVSAAGGPVTVLARSQRNPHQVVAAGGYVYWLASPGGNGAVMRAPIQGGAPSSRAKTFILAHAALTADDTYVYWTDKNAIMWAPHQAGKVETAVQLSEDAGTSIHALAVHDSKLYWEMAGEIVVADMNSDRIAVTMAKDTGSVWGIVADNDGVYWTDKSAGNGEVMRVLFSGRSAGVAEAADRSAKLPWGIATDASFIWTARNGEGRIVGNAKRGNAIHVVHSEGGSYPVDVAVDREAIYWTEAGSKRIMKLVK